MKPEFEWLEGQAELFGSGNSLDVAEHYEGLHKMEGGRRIKARSIGHLHQGERRLRCRECLQDPKPVYQRLGDPCAIGVYCHVCSECE